MSDFINGQQPEQAAVQAVAAVSRVWGRRVLDLFRLAFTIKSGALTVAGLAVAVLAVVSLPLLAGIGSAVVVIGAVTLMVFAYRLMVAERAARRWGRIGVLRAQQRALRAETKTELLQLVLDGDHAMRSQLIRFGGSTLLASVQHRQAGFAAAQSQTQAGVQARARRRLRVTQLQAELKATEAEIQALADPTSKASVALANETRAMAQHMRAAALRADREARARRRRGMTPTVPPGKEVRMQVGLAPGGVADVRVQSAQTPEQIALDSDPPRAAGRT